MLGLFRYIKHRKTLKKLTIPPFDYRVVNKNIPLQTFFQCAFLSFLGLLVYLTEIAHSKFFLNCEVMRMGMCFVQEKSSEVDVLKLDVSTLKVEKQQQQAKLSELRSALKSSIQHHKVRWAG